MTVRHVVVFLLEPRRHEPTTWRRSTRRSTPSRARSLASAATTTAPTSALGEGRWDYGIVAECDDVDGWRAYEQHPAHQQVVTEVIRPRIAERAAVQIGH